ncbi:MAG: hypothetical protein EAZ97_08435 [Bacteroidetes bacterium]|nr:MAG: hypothetical protein EAZ97_08435 [Bacteroidota bacterium]
MNIKNLTLLFIIGFILFLPNQSVFAQKLLAVLVVDTQNPTTGKGHSKNLKNIENELQIISKQTGLSLQNYVLENQKFSYENLTLVLQDLPVNSQDVVFFYFSGSEYIGGRQEGLHLRLNNENIALQEINEKLNAKKARLNIVLTDVCNGFSDQKIVQDAENQEIDKNKLKDKYISLFLRSSGKVAMSNHVIREQNDVKTSAAGSIFTANIIEAIHENTQADNQWKKTIDDSRMNTILESGRTQNPQIQSFSITQADILEINKKDLTKVKIKTDEISKIVSKTEDLKIPIAEISAQALEKVNLFQEELSKSFSLDNENTKDWVLKLMNLFVDRQRTIELSSSSGKLNKKNLENYLGTLQSSQNDQKIQIQWYKPAEIGNFSKQSNGIYKAEAKIFQEYKKLDSNGKLIYGDRVEKKVSLQIKNVSSDLQKPIWNIFLGNISVVQGSIELLK